MTIVLGTAGVFVWKWVDEYLEYRQFVAPLTGTEFDTGESIEEFLAYRRGIALYDAAERLGDAHASLEEVKDALGAPQYTFQNEDGGVISWAYTGPEFRGHRQPTIVFDVDPTSLRVKRVAYIRHG
jgi:hypothetical protein